jgi:hypothetical protein
MFTGDLPTSRGCCDPTVPLRHAARFPGLGLLRVLRPPRRHQPTTSLPAHQPEDQWERTAATVPTITALPLVEGGAQLYPCRIATTMPQTFIVTSRPATSNRPKSSPPSWRVRAVTRGVRLRPFSRWVLTYAFSSRLPDPCHLAVLTRTIVVGAAVYPHPRPRDQAAQLALACCDRRATVSFQRRTVTQRLVALQVGNPYSRSPSTFGGTMWLMRPFLAAQALESVAGAPYGTVSTRRARQGR